MGLESLNENLPEIKVELTFRQRRLQFKPPLEDIRVKYGAVWVSWAHAQLLTNRSLRYYREMKRFIQLPENTPGLSGGKIWHDLASRNAGALQAVYEKAEALFGRLQKVRDHHQPYVVLGMVDLEGLVADSLSEVSDWEHNFRAVKARGRDAEKLPNTIKVSRDSVAEVVHAFTLHVGVQVDCITVSMAPLKAALDDQLNRLFEALCTSLRKSATKDIAAIEQFLDHGMDALSERPTTIEDIGRTNAQHAQISKDKPTIKPLFQAAETKNALLATVSGVAVGVEMLNERWDKFEILLESHEMMIKDQIDVMRNGVESRIATVNHLVCICGVRLAHIHPDFSSTVHLRSLSQNGMLLNLRMMPCRRDRQQ